MLADLRNIEIRLTLKVRDETCDGHRTFTFPRIQLAAVSLSLSLYSSLPGSPYRHERFSD